MPFGTGVDFIIEWTCCGFQIFRSSLVNMDEPWPGSQCIALWFNIRSWIFERENAP
jgi:hypothetical protein